MSSKARGQEGDGVRNFLGRHGFATVFTSAPSLQHGMANVMFANTAYVIVDGIQTALTGCDAARGGVPGACRPTKTQSMSPSTT